MPLTVLGAGLLWFGWFGFNAGSALSANEIAALAFVSDQYLCSRGALSWVAAEWLHHGKPTVFGAVSTSSQAGGYHPGGRLCQSPGGHRHGFDPPDLYAIWL